MREKTAILGPVPDEGFWSRLQNTIDSIQGWYDYFAPGLKETDPAKLKDFLREPRSRSKMYFISQMKNPFGSQGAYGQWISNAFDPDTATLMWDLYQGIRNGASMIDAHLKPARKVLNPERDLEELSTTFWMFVDNLDLILDELKKLHSKVGPTHFTYRGFRVENPDHLSDEMIKRLISGIDWLVGIFRKHGMKSLLDDGVKKFVLRFQRPGVDNHPLGGLADGWYHGGKKYIELLHSLVRRGKGHRGLQNAIAEVVLHEFGHYVHLDYLHPRAKKEWDEGWAPVERAKKDLEKLYKVTPQERHRFFKLIEKSGWDPYKAGRKVKGVDRLKYLAWLYKTEANRVSSVPTQVRLTPYGKKVFEFFKDPVSAFPEVADYDTEEERQTYLSKWIPHRMRVYKSNLGLTDYYDNIDTPYLDANMVEKVRAEDKTVDEALDKLEMPTSYARTNSREDFADTFTVFMVDPNRLSDRARYRMQRALSLSGLYGKPVLRAASEVIAALAITAKLPSPPPRMLKTVTDIVVKQQTANVTGKPYKGVQPMAYGTEKMVKVPLDLRGWYDGTRAIKARIHQFVEKQTREMWQMLVDRRGEEAARKFFERDVEAVVEDLFDSYSNIRLNMKYTAGAGEADWWSAMKILNVNVSDWSAVRGTIQGAIEHEMMHFSADLLSYAFHGVSMHSENLPDVPGFPPMDIRTPQYRQQDKPHYDPEAEFTWRELHALDDREFYTELRDAVDEFTRYRRGKPSEAEVERFLDRHQFFRALKRAPAARKKYDLAVREFHEGVRL